MLLKKSAFIEIRQKHTRPGFQAFTRESRVVNEVYNILKGQLALAEQLIDLPCTTAKGIEFIDKIVKQKILPEKIGKEAKLFYETPIRVEDEPRSRS